MDNKALVTVKEMAEILSVPVSWIYQRTCLGQHAIPYIKMGRYVRFEPHAVIDFLKKQGQKELR